MTNKTTSVATAPDGRTFEKVSLKGKHFPYAVIARGDNPTWELFSFHSTQSAAESKARSEQAWWSAAGRTAERGEFRVVETEATNA